MTRNCLLAALASASLFALHTPALAAQVDQAPAAADRGDSATTSGDEIIVQARRRNESQQDVPLVVNAVTSESLEKLNIREFQDVQSLVPGLSLSVSANGVGTQASLRGVAFDVNASGNNGTIEFYLNDAPLSAGILFQSMFDVGQIEVLRGPQGTLRGRASPSGSITVTTRRPDLSEVGGYVQSSLNTHGSWNLNGAINVPLIEGKLAVRLAGVADESDGDRVHSINNPADPNVSTNGGRISIAAEPVHWLSLYGSYTHTERKARQFYQVESANLADPTWPASSPVITPGDRLAVGYVGRNYVQNFEVFNWGGQAQFAGQKLDYVGSRNKQRYDADETNDKGAYFGPSYPAALLGARQYTFSGATQTTHELRLSSDERIADLFDYVVGGLYNKLQSPTDLVVQTPLFLGFFVPQATFPTFVTPGGITPVGAASGAGFGQVVDTAVSRDGGFVEKSLFGNVTAHLGSKFELSAGARYIHYKSNGHLEVAGQVIPAADEARTTRNWVFSGSAKYQVTPDIMVYASYGSSYRPGSSTNPIIFRDTVAPDARVSSLFFPGDEKSRSYEIGFKSELFDRRLRLNVSAYHQDFKNYAFSVRNIYYAGIDPSGAQRVLQANPGLATGVPAKVNGVEGEIAFRASSQWNLSATASYAKSKISTGTVPCNVYGGAVPTYDRILAANGGNQIALCPVNYSASPLAPFSATVQSEFVQPIGANLEGYLRGLMTFNGNSKNDPSNPFDDVKAYGLVNLFAGLRDRDGGWEIGGYVKNLFDTERVLSRDPGPYSIGYTQLACTSQVPGCPAATVTYGQNAVSSYRGITMTPAREIGITARIALGSR